MGSGFIVIELPGLVEVEAEVFIPGGAEAEAGAEEGIGGVVGFGMAGVDEGEALEVPVVSLQDGGSEFGGEEDTGVAEVGGFAESATALAAA